jgi:hypothetical protein
MGVTELCYVIVVVTVWSSPLYVYRKWRFKISPLTFVFVLYLRSELTDRSVFMGVSTVQPLSLRYLAYVYVVQMFCQEGITANVLSFLFSQLCIWKSYLRYYSG